MVSNVTPNLQVITREIFDLPCVLKAPKSFDAVDWKVSFFYNKFNGELVSKEFSFQFTRKCMTSSKRYRVFSAAEHHCRAAISKPYQ